MRVAIKFLVAIPIPEPELGIIAGIKASLRPEGWHDTINPHITLLAPDRPLMSFDDAAKSFQTAFSESTEFLIRAKLVKHFAHRNHRVLFFSPTPKAPLLKLYRTALNRSPWQETTASIKRAYYPHITLASHLPTNKSIQIEEELQALRLDLQFNCTKICLYAKQQNWQRWQQVAESTLCKSQNQQ
jgi:2'-5' RNA ligase